MVSKKLFFGRRACIRGASAAAASSKREDLPELVDHLVHHHEASTRGAVSAIIRQQRRGTGPWADDDERADGCRADTENAGGRAATRASRHRPQRRSSSAPPANVSTTGRWQQDFFFCLL